MLGRGGSSDGDKNAKVRQLLALLCRIGTEQASRDPKGVLAGRISVREVLPECVVAVGIQNPTWAECCFLCKVKFLSGQMVSSMY